MAVSDIAAVVALAATLRDAPQWPAEAYSIAVRAEVRPDRYALVAEASGLLAGFAVASVIAPEAELEAIVVAKDFQRRGIARSLLAALSFHLQSRGITALLLEVRAANTAARGFYAAERFEEAGRRPGYYSRPADDAILLKRNLF